MVQVITVVCRLVLPWRSSQSSCYGALVEVTAIAGGVAGEDITSADMVWFNVDSTWLAASLLWSLALRCDRLRALD